MPVYRVTNAGLQTKGTLWAGFDPTVSSVVAGVFMISVMFTFAAISVLKMAWTMAVAAFFLGPNVTLLAAIFGLVVGKPPRYLLDWLDSRVVGRTEVELARVPAPEAPEVEP